MDSDEPKAHTTGGDETHVPTRGFLFADLRGYTEFVERHGAVTAAELLEHYREMVRRCVALFGGAEIRTEGDSFYVVFESVSQAVRCGLAIVEAAADASAARPDPIRVGVGIHAGETVETPDGYVGTPVNIAARLCARADVGEVLVSDTVRALTQTVLPFRFENRGRKQLKGVAEPVATYSVEPMGDGLERGAVPSAASRRRRRRRIAALAVVCALVGIGVATGLLASRGSSGLPSGPWAIALDMPFSGPVNYGVPARDALRLAIDEANAAGGIGGARISLESRDDGPSSHDPTRGVHNTEAFVADPRVIAMIGPAQSPIAMAEIPITNAAGFLQCSPASTNPGLTKPRYGALDLRAAAPERINYVRVAPSDDIQGPAAASFLFDDLGVRRLLVIDDSGDGRQIADSVSAAFQKLGGTAIRRALNPGADPRDVLGPLRAGEPRMGVYFGGFAETGAPEVRKSMVASGLGKLPFVSWDGIGGSGTDAGSFIQRAGRSAVGSYQSSASFALPKADFVNAYRAKFGSEPDVYTVATYACAQVILDAFRMVASKGTSATGLREALRAEAADPSHQYSTVLGTIGFDANGDSRQQFVTFYRVDPTADGGKGDWVIEKQQDYGPAP